MTNQPMQDYQKYLKELNNNKQALKEQYLKIINDKNIALDIRWETFLDAPKDFKEHSPYVVHFDVLENNVDNFNWYDYMYLEKHETMNTDTMIERIEDNMQEYDENNGLSQVFYNHPELLNMLKEEVLEQNLGSFEYDW